MIVFKKVLFFMPLCLVFMFCVSCGHKTPPAAPTPSVSPSLFVSASPSVTSSSSPSPDDSSVSAGSKEVLMLEAFNHYLNAYLNVNNMDKTRWLEALMPYVTLDWWNSLNASVNDLESIKDIKIIAPPKVLNDYFSLISGYVEVKTTKNDWVFVLNLIDNRWLIAGMISRQVYNQGE